MINILTFGVTIPELFRLKVQSSFESCSSDHTICQFLTIKFNLTTLSQVSRDKYTE